MRNLSPIIFIVMFARIASADVFNVKSAPFNATGDGKSDDTAAILAADQATAKTGGKLYFPAGTYLISASVPTAATNVSIVGEGREASILKYIGNDAAIVFGNPDYPKSPNFSGIYLADVGIDLSRAGNSAIGVRLDGATRSQIERIVVAGNKSKAQSGIYFYNNCWIDVAADCRVTDCKYDFRFAPPNHDTQVANACIIRGGEAQGGTYGVVLGDETANSQQSPLVGYGTIIEDLEIEGVSQAGVWLAEGDGPIVTRCRFEGNAQDIRIGNSAGNFARQPILTENYFVSFKSADHTCIHVLKAESLKEHDNLFILGGKGKKCGVTYEGNSNASTRLGPDTFPSLTPADQYSVPANFSGTIEK